MLLFLLLFAGVLYGVGSGLFDALFHVAMRILGL